MQKNLDYWNKSLDELINKDEISNKNKPHSKYIKNDWEVSKSCNMKINVNK